jgi:hypothetical protein
MVKINPRIVMRGRSVDRTAKAVPGVRLEPADGDGFTAADMRKLLKHPTAGGFRPEGDIEWPNDTFTFRRLKEGSVKLSENPQQQPTEEQQPPTEESN